MSARDELTNYTAGLNASMCLERCVGCSCAEADAKDVNDLIDGLLREHAHELAEKIRAEVAPLAVFRSEETRALVKYGRRLADLIDPEATP